MSKKPPRACPFCGSEEIHTGFAYSRSDKWGWAYCNDCGARSAEVRVGFESTGESAGWREYALKLWNTRAEQKPVINSFWSESVRRQVINKCVEAIKKVLGEVEE